MSALFNLEIAARAGLSAWRNAHAAKRCRGPIDLFLCIVDHFEPQHGRPEARVSRKRVEEWMTLYPRIAGAHRDWGGFPPSHGFFYPWDEFDPWEFDRLVELCSDGFGEIELHLHHRGDTEDSLAGTLRAAIAEYRRRRALSEWSPGRPAFGFIHGDWALNNSRSDGGRDYCGVNDEVSLLVREGCYADFTFPAWKHTAQPREVNRIYPAKSSRERPKGHDRPSRPPEPGRWTPEPGVPAFGPSEMLIVQGPLTVSLAGRFPRLRPSVEDGDLASYRRYEPARLDRWVNAAIHWPGRPDRRFIKLHTHGAPEGNRRALLDGDLEALFTDAGRRYNDGERFRLHHVSARQMYNIVIATARGDEADAVEARDRGLKPPC